MSPGSDQKQPYELGFIHGRFQILHNDHLKYLLAGKALCKHLIVGITNPDPSLTRDDQADPNRSTNESNPLTYYERQVLVREALLGAGLDCRELHHRPLPGEPAGVVFLLCAERGRILCLHL